MLTALFCFLEASLFLLGMAQSTAPQHIYRLTHEARFEIVAKKMFPNGSDYRGNFTLGLFGATVPLTVKNIVQLTNGYSNPSENRRLHYNGTHMHRIVKDFLVQMGDVVKKDGSSGTSIYGKHFKDENFLLPFHGPGWAGMANTGPDTNNSQFFITIYKARWLNGRNVAFGKVIRGFDTIRILNEVDANLKTEEPKVLIQIVHCQAWKLQEPYDMSMVEVESLEDMPEFQYAKALDWDS